LHVAVGDWLISSCWLLVAWVSTLAANGVEGRAGSSFSSSNTNPHSTTTTITRFSFWGGRSFSVRRALVQVILHVVDEYLLVLLAAGLGQRLLHQLGVETGLQSDRKVRSLLWN